MDGPMSEERFPNEQSGEGEGAEEPPLSSPETPHLILNPAWLAPAIGYAHAVVPAAGHMVFLSGQAGHRPDGTLAGESLLEQFDQACGNVVEALAAAGGQPEDIVSMQVFVTDATEYRSSLGEIGAAYRRHFGPHYPAMAMLEVNGLFDPRARVELMCVAVVPESPPLE
jgi:enamine deaminase RidA (YjgF/YER057c/UK114 family)